MRAHIISVTSIIAIAMGSTSASAQGVQSINSVSPNAHEARLMRYPDIAGEQITFVYGDKLWIANASGKGARQLPSTGTELSRPHFSPDGKRIAYSAKVDGNVDIYVVATDGASAPRRITHHPAIDLVVDWDRSGQNILFASTMASPRATYDQLYLVSYEGGLPHRLPLPYGETAAFNEDGTKLIFTYKRDFQEEAWKRYYGGRAPDIWSYDFKSGETLKLTDSKASDSMPMRVDGRTYYLSEGDTAGRSNIWVLGSKPSENQEVTKFTDTDVRRPATDGKRIIYEADGKLEILDPRSGQTIPIDVEIDPQSVAPPDKPEPVAERLMNAALTLDGGVVAEVRGDIFEYDASGARASDLTPNSSGSAERFPRPNSNGDIAFVSDRDGEYALYIRTASDGVVHKLADFGAGFRYNPFWSPDGRYIAIYDQAQVLWLVDVASGEKTRIDQGKWWYSTDLVDQRVAWSADSHWIAYSRGLDNRNNALFLFDVGKREKHQLTSGALNDFAPVFDTSGNYLLALSTRRFEPTAGDGNIDNTWTYAPNTVVSVLPLTAAIRAPGRPGWTMPATRAAMTVELDDIEARLVVLDVNPGNLTGLSAVPDGFVVNRLGEGLVSPNKIERYVLGQANATTLQAAPGLSLIDADARHLLSRRETEFSVIDLADAKIRPLDKQQLVMKIDRPAEAQQMFNDAWRYGRDFYYDPGMHGADWNGARIKLGALVKYAVTDDDVTFLVRELMGELNGGHVYASATAPRPRGDAQNVGLLGADFEWSGKGYRIVKIYHTGPREYEIRSPLDDSTLGIREGDVLVAVNDKALVRTVDPWAAFVNLADKEVDLTIIPAAGGAAKVVRVRTLKSERKLRELAWVEDNRRKVEQASNGRLGYIYVPNTGSEGQTELMIQYRSQFNKDALIVDERFNTGGALGDRLIELLQRPPLVRFRARNSTDYPLPELAHRGPTVMISNGWSYSGGDGFPLLFKAAKIGPLIGTRTWGGLIGPGLSLPLVNGGFISAAPQRVYGLAGKWSEGNEGVRPDIEIENDPGALAKGTDTQLNTAISIVVGQIRDLKPVEIPPFYGAGDWNPANRGEQ